MTTLFVGGIIAWLSFVAGVLILLVNWSEDEPAPLWASTAPFIGPAIVMIFGIWMAMNPLRRAVGLGMVCSVPFAGLITFSLCSIRR